MAELPPNMVHTILTIYDNGYKSEAAVAELLNKQYGSHITVQRVKEELIKQRRIRIKKSLFGKTVTYYENPPDDD